MEEKSTGNIVDLDLLQAYVDANDALHEAVGAPRGAHLALEPFAQGEYNANYAFDVPDDAADSRPRHLLVRVNLGSQMHLDDQIGYEAAALRLLEPCGRTPRMLYVDPAPARFPHGLLVEERLPGRALDYRRDLVRAARLLADVHALPEPVGSPLVAPSHPLAAVVEECAAMFAVYRAWPRADPAVASRVDALFARADELAATDRLHGVQGRRHIVNTELNSGNFLMNDGGRDYLVDWEKPVLGEVAQDLAHFLAPTTTFWKTDVVLARTDMEGFLDAYERAASGRFATDGVRERFEDYLVVTCLRGITWCAMALTEYLGDERAARNAATLAKIRAYLEPGFLDFVAREHYGL